MESVKHLPRETIDKVTHGNVLRIYDFDAFGMMGGRENCTAGALRKLATHVDTTPVSYGGPAPLAPGEQPRIVTSGDITKMFADVRNYDGQVDMNEMQAAE
ncbi:MAG: hypothetical protein ABW128_12405 [Rhizorhabdus sp.]